MVKTKQNILIDNLRFFAIVTVVLGHSIILYSGTWSLYSTTRQAPLFDYLKRLINLYQMPLFMALSGYLFAYHAPGQLLPLLWKKSSV